MKMKRFSIKGTVIHWTILIASVQFLSFIHGPTEYTIKPELSKIVFSYNGLMAASGKINGLKGEIKFDPEKPEEAYIELSLDPKTIDTKSDLRDKHFKEEGYFNVEKYPLLKIRSKSAQKLNSAFQLNADMSIKETTKEIKIPFVFVRSNDIVAFKGKFEVNRLDYKLGGSTIAAKNIVTIDFEIIAVKK
jgi:polyisoprenoid-binding protein YceI